MEAATNVSGNSISEKDPDVQRWRHRHEDTAQNNIAYIQTAPRFVNEYYSPPYPIQKPVINNVVTKDIETYHLECTDFDIDEPFAYRTYIYGHGNHSYQSFLCRLLIRSQELPWNSSTTWPDLFKRAKRRR
jgi:hypothetical protein